VIDVDKLLEADIMLSQQEKKLLRDIAEALYRNASRTEDGIVLSLQQEAMLPLAFVILTGLETLDG